MAERLTDSECPRCEGQSYDRGSCSLCGNLGFLCPECASQMKRTPIYSNMRQTYRCTECGLVVADEVEMPVAPGKLIPLKRQGATGA